MAMAETNDTGATQGSVVPPAVKRAYVVPSLSRFGTLAELTRSNGTKNGNDSGGPGNGCGQGSNFLFSCAQSEGT
jgi:hypothetical protein